MQPIRDEDKDSHHREFFRPDFMLQRLGRPGHWQGGAVAKLGLKDPVRAEVFEKLLEGQTPEGERLVNALATKETRVKGWRLSFGEEGKLSALWALSPPMVQARLRLAHGRAVHQAVSAFERALNGNSSSNKPFSPGWKLTLFAGFQSGATPEHAPRLQTTLFLFNFSIHRDGGFGSLSTDQVIELRLQMKSVYNQGLRSEALWVVGGRMEIPDQLPFRFHTEFTARVAESIRTGRSQQLEGSRLFAAWQEQAREWDWGPERVSKLLMDARSQNTWRNWAQDLKQNLRAGLVWLHDPPHSVEKVANRLANKDHSKATEQPKQTEQSKTMSQSY